MMINRKEICPVNRPAAAILNGSHLVISLTSNNWRGVAGGTDSKNT